jgi:hypothetical protein
MSHATLQHPAGFRVRGDTCDETPLAAASAISSACARESCMRTVQPWPSRRGTSGLATPRSAQAHRCRAHPALLRRRRGREGGSEAEAVPTRTSMEGCGGRWPRVLLMLPRPRWSCRTRSPATRASAEEGADKLPSACTTYNRLIASECRIRVRTSTTVAQPHAHAGTHVLV